MNQATALIVDDEPDIRELLEITLGRMEIGTQAAQDLQEAKSLLGTHRFDLCLGFRALLPQKHCCCQSIPGTLARLLQQV